MFHIAQKTNDDSWEIFERRNYINKSPIKVLKNPEEILNNKQLCQIWLDQYDLIIALNWKADYKIRDYY